MSELASESSTRREEADLFRTAVDERRVVVQRCHACGTASLPPAPSCLHCGSPEVETVDAATIGTLHTWTVCHVAFDPAWADEVPYVLGIVELADGARIPATVLTSPDEVRDGMPLRLEWRTSPADGRPVWAFQP